MLCRLAPAVQYKPVPTERVFDAPLYLLVVVVKAGAEDEHYIARVQRIDRIQYRYPGKLKCTYE